MAMLVDLYLVEPVATTSDTPRFRFLDAIHEFALEKLRAAGEEDELTRRLVDWVVKFAEQVKVGVDGSFERAWLDAANEDAPTIAAGLSQLERDQDPRRGLAVAEGVGMSWVRSGPISQGRHWFDTFLGLDTSNLADEEVAIAEAWRARLLVESGDMSVVDDIERARDEITDLDEWLRATEHLAYARTMQGDLDSADALTESAILRAESERTFNWLAVFLVRRAMAAQRRGLSDQAVLHAQRAADVARRAGIGHLLARAQQIIALEEPNPRLAYERLLEVRAAYLSSGDRRGAVSALAALGRLAPPAEATRWLREAIELAANLGYRHGELFSICVVVAKAIEAGRIRDAVELDAALDPYMPVVKANVPPRFFENYVATVAHVRQAVGNSEYKAMVSDTPRGFGWLRQRALAVVDALSAEVIPGSESTTPARRPRGRPKQPSLSGRELEILEAIARGGTNAQIGSELSISAKTVMHHSANVYRKLGVRGRAEAITFAYRTGLISPNVPDRPPTLG
jgi:DNA-binding CsgD family transcriptional regulator/tetratricopeptide (TPR) repeat protein